MWLTGGSCAYLLLALTLCQGLVQAKNDNYQISDVCKKNYMRDLYRKIDGAVLMSRLEKDLDCTITFQTHSILQRFMLRFDQLQLDCNDHLYIYDGAHAVSSYKICDKTKCAGPLRYYEAIGCTPVYANSGDCCAESYNCSHLDNLSRDKCYANGNEYSLGEKLKPEDANPCDIACTCRSYRDVADFICAAVDCALIGPKENCYFKHEHDKCCPNTAPTCYAKEDEIVTCVVDGVTYREGQQFNLISDPDLNCICMPGYTGENVEPFCKKPNRDYCSPLFRNAESIHEKCAPMFYANQNPQKDCSYAFRCQDTGDTVIHNHAKSADVSDEEHKICRFGNMTMHLGDELSQGTSYSSNCVKCVCEVPPIPTCQRLADKDCPSQFGDVSISVPNV